MRYSYASRLVTNRMSDAQIGCVQQTAGMLSELYNGASNYEL